MKSNLSLSRAATGLALGLTFVLAAGGAAAQTLSSVSSASAVNARLEANRIEIVDGKTNRSSAARAVPGDVVEYQATYANSGRVPVSNVFAVVPVPIGTTLLAGSAVPATGVQASTDGSTTFAAMPLKRSVKGADGKVHEELVPLAEYRALRWRVASLAAGADTSVSLRVQLDLPSAGAAAVAAVASTSTLASKP